VHAGRRFAIVPIGHIHHHLPRGARKNPARRERELDELASRQAVICSRRTLLGSSCRGKRSQGSERRGQYSQPLRMPDHVVYSSNAAITCLPCPVMCDFIRAAAARASRFTVAR